MNNLEKTNQFNTQRVRTRTNNFLISKKKKKKKKKKRRRKEEDEGEKEEDKNLFQLLGEQPGSHSPRRIVGRKIDQSCLSILLRQTTERQVRNKFDIKTFLPEHCTFDAERKGDTVVHLA